MFNQPAMELESKPSDSKGQSHLSHAGPTATSPHTPRVSRAPAPAKSLRIPGRPLAPSKSVGGRHKVQPRAEVLAGGQWARGSRLPASRKHFLSGMGKERREAPRKQSSPGIFLPIRGMVSGHLWVLGSAGIPPQAARLLGVETSSPTKCVVHRAPEFQNEKSREMCFAQGTREAPARRNSFQLQMNCQNLTELLVCMVQIMSSFQSSVRF